MGYRTYYNLTVLLPDGVTEHPDADQIVDNLREQNEDAFRAFGYGGSSQDSVTWYEHREDMTEFSKKYPDAVFELFGEGESSGDLWIQYFHRGRFQRCPARIEYDPYDPAKLTDN